ncbi:MAG: hypothetical protein LBS10_10905 [Gracilibacteraceae bacterium]|jgi:hypothetical protein|nr:hypothetical protein [Gracilibacteraceae bacterium]
MCELCHTHDPVPADMELDYLLSRYDGSEADLCRLLHRAGIIFAGLPEEVLERIARTTARPRAELLAQAGR